MKDSACDAGWGKGVHVTFVGKSSYDVDENKGVPVRLLVRDSW